jgi:hypothetical protein
MSLKGAIDSKRVFWASVRVLNSIRRVTGLWLAILEISSLTGYKDALGLEKRLKVIKSRRHQL